MALDDQTTGSLKTDARNSVRGIATHSFYRLHRYHCLP
jgi:hypothetical protein